MPDHRHLAWLVVATALVALAPVAEDPPGPQRATAEEADSWEWPDGSLGSVFGCGANTEATFEVRDAAAWNATWTTCRAGYGIVMRATPDGMEPVPSQPVPSVDFSSHMVVGYAWGVQTGRSVDLTFDAASSTLMVTRYWPGTCSYVMLGGPVGQLSVVERTDAPVTFQIHDTVRPECR